MSRKFSGIGICALPLRVRVIVTAHDVWFADVVAYFSPIFGHIFEIDVLYDVVALWEELPHPCEDPKRLPERPAIFAFQTRSGVGARPTFSALIPWAIR